MLGTSGTGPEATNVAFTRPFELEAGKNVEIAIDASVSNSWVYVAVDLVNDKTGKVVSYDHNIEYYFGYSGGESWTEGSTTATQTLAAMEPGTYVLRVETLPPTMVQVIVRQDVFSLLWFAIFGGVLVLPFGLIALHAHHFKQKRWENSSLTRSYDPGTAVRVVDDDGYGWGADG